jgi:hypothetical protein
MMIMMIMMMNIPISATHMMTNPVAVSKEEVREIAELFVREGNFGHENIEDTLIDLEGAYIAKFERYITYGPGYSGEAFVILHGIPVASVILRRPNGELYVSEDR